MGNISTLWSGITNPIALEIVRTFFNTASSHTDQGDYETYFEKLSPGLRQYQTWLRDGLQRSNLAQRLAAGLDWLPDFAQELPQPLGFMFKFTQPRKMYQVPQHLMIFLEWYVDPRRAEPIAKRAIIWGILICILLISVVAVFIVLDLFNVLDLVLITIMLGCTSCSGLVYLLTQGVSSPVKRSINATELYWYFRHEFTEPPSAEAN